MMWRWAGDTTISRNAMTYLEALASLSSYPLPKEQLVLILRGRGLIPDDDLRQGSLEDRRYLLAKADTMRALSAAPNITQEGISYDLLYSTRQTLLEEARAIYRLYLAPGDPLYPKRKPRYGYKGSLLKR